MRGSPGGPDLNRRFLIEPDPPGSRDGKAVKFEQKEAGGAGVSLASTGCRNAHVTLRLSNLEVVRYIIRQ